MASKFSNHGEASKLQEEITRIRELITKRDREYKLTADGKLPIIEMVEDEDYIKLDN